MNTCQEQSFIRPRTINRFTTWAFPNRHLRITPYRHTFPPYCQPPCNSSFTSLSFPLNSPYSAYANYSPYSSF